MKAFPKIFTIGTDYIKDIFNEEVEITEKVDGSQFAFAKINGELFLRSKGKQLFPEACEKMFQKAVDYVVSIQELIPENMGFYCEFLSKPKHNCLIYERVPKNNLMLFGVTYIKEDKFHPDLNTYEELFNIERVPIIFKGKIDTPQTLLEMLELNSVLGNVKIEGVVVKNYHRPFLLGGLPIPLMSGKFVSEAFKEKANTEWKSQKTTSGGYNLLLESYRTEARWLKSIQHLKENGELENSPRDIGKLVKEIGMDLDAEETDSIKESLYQLFIKDIKRKAIAGFPEFYKEYLLKNSFDSTI